MDHKDGREDTVEKERFYVGGITAWLAKTHMSPQPLRNLLWLLLLTKGACDHSGIRCHPVVVALSHHQSFLFSPWTPPTPYEWPALWMPYCVFSNDKRSVTPCSICGCPGNLPLALLATIKPCSFLPKKKTSTSCSCSQSAVRVFPKFPSLTEEQISQFRTSMVEWKSRLSRELSWHSVNGVLAMCLLPVGEVFHCTHGMCHDCNLHINK